MRQLQRKNCLNACGAEEHWTLFENWHAFSRILKVMFGSRKILRKEQKCEGK